MESSQPSRLRVLCLHGFRQTAKQFSGRLAAFQKRLRKDVEFVFADGPLLIPALGPAAQDDDTDHSFPRADRRAWFKSPVGAGLVLDSTQWQTQTEGWERSILEVARVFATQGPFDGVLGFSQGGALALTLCAIQQTGDDCLPVAAASPAEDDQSETLARLIRQVRHQIRFGFVMLFSAMLPAPPPLRRLIASAPLSLPSLHVFGSADRQTADGALCSDVVRAFAGREYSLDSGAAAAAAAAPGPWVVRHAAGHVVPSARVDTALYREFILTATTPAHR
jgi:hypothetical protein